MRKPTRAWSRSRMAARIASAALVGIFLALGLSGCADEEPSQSRDFRMKYFRHKLFDVDFVDNAHGWVCGDYGLVWNTTDGGKTWVPRESGTILPLRGISFGDSKNGWAVGDQGIILRSADGGATWVKQESGIKEHLMEVEFLDCQKGFAIGVFAALLLTEDGGVHWQDISARVKEKEKEMEFFLSESEETVAAETGETEEDVDIVGEGMPTLEPLLNDICFVDAQTGWIVGEEGNVFHTSDGGATWKKQTSGVGDDLFSVYFKDSREGWITGLNGLLLHTVDSGTTWTKQECPGAESLFGIVVSGDRGYAVGNAASMIATSDGGKSWQNFDPAGITLYSWFRRVAALNGKFVVVGGLGTVLMTDTTGQNWLQIS